MCMSVQCTCVHKNIKLDVQLVYDEIVNIDIGSIACVHMLGFRLLIKCCIMDDVYIIYSSSQYSKQVAFSEW